MEIVGPGIWFTIHTQAIKATTDLLKRAFISNINILCDNFRCNNCRQHFREFIIKYPLENYWNIKNNKKEDIGFFQWTWEFHNNVNIKLGKPTPSFGECYNYYSNTELSICLDCGNNQDNVELYSKGIPTILTLYRKTGIITPKPFKSVHNS